MSADEVVKAIKFMNECQIISSIRDRQFQLFMFFLEKRLAGECDYATMRAKVEMAVYDMNVVEEEAEWITERTDEFYE